MSKERIIQLLRQLNITEETEIDCQQAQALLPAYVEAELDGEEVEVALHNVWTHLQHCPDCRDEYLALRRAVTVEKESEWPGVRVSEQVLRYQLLEGFREERPVSDTEAEAESLPDRSGPVSSHPTA